MSKIPFYNSSSCWDCFDNIISPLQCYSAVFSLLKCNLVRNLPRKSWLECVNDDMKKLGLRREMHTIGPYGGRLFIGTSKLRQHGKCDVKRIDR